MREELKKGTANTKHSIAFTYMLLNIVMFIAKAENTACSMHMITAAAREYLREDNAADIFMINILKMKLSSRNTSIYILTPPLCMKYNNSVWF